MASIYNWNTGWLGTCNFFEYHLTCEESLTNLYFVLGYFKIFRRKTRIITLGRVIGEPDIFRCRPVAGCHTHFTANLFIISYWKSSFECIVGRDWEFSPLQFLPQTTPSDMPLGICIHTIESLTCFPVWMKPYQPHFHLTNSAGPFSVGRGSQHNYHWNRPHSIHLPGSIRIHSRLHSLIICKSKRMGEDLGRPARMREGCVVWNGAFEVSWDVSLSSLDVPKNQCLLELCYEIEN